MIGCKVFVQRKNESRKMRNSGYVHSWCRGHGRKSSISGPSHEPGIHGQDLIFENIKARGKTDSMEM